MKKNMFSYIIFPIFLSIFLVIIFSITSFISGSILTFLGLKYTSIKALLLFFLIYFILATPADLICDALAKVLKEFNSMNDSQILIIESLISVLANTIVLCIADFVVKGVTIAFISKLLASIIIFVLCKFVEFKLKKLDERMAEYEKISLENERKQMENAINEMEDTISKEIIDESEITSKIDKLNNLNK